MYVVRISVSSTYSILSCILPLSDSIGYPYFSYNESVIPKFDEKLLLLNCWPLRWTGVPVTPKMSRNDFHLKFTTVQNGQVPFTELCRRCSEMSWILHESARK